MAEQKKTAGAKAPAKRKSVAKSSDATETVTSKAVQGSKAPEGSKSSAGSKRPAAKAAASRSIARTKTDKVEAKETGRRPASATKTRNTGSIETKTASRPAEARKTVAPVSEVAASLFDLPPASAATGKATIADPVAEPKTLTGSLKAAAAPSAKVVEAGTGQVLQTLAKAQATTATLRSAVAETTTATTSTVLEVNGKLIDAMRAQSEAAFDLWRSTLSAGSLSEAVRLQTSGARQAYENAANHWKDVAETTTRWFSAAMKPMRSALTDRSRQ